MKNIQHIAQTNTRKMAGIGAIALASFMTTAFYANQTTNVPHFLQTTSTVSADNAFNSRDANTYPADGIYDENNNAGIPSYFFKLSIPLNVTINVDGQEYQKVNKTFTMHRKVIVKTENGVKKAYWTFMEPESSDANIVNQLANNASDTTWGQSQQGAFAGGGSWLTGIAYQINLTDQQATFESSDAAEQTSANDKNVLPTNHHYFFTSHPKPDNMYGQPPYLTVDGYKIANSNGDVWQGPNVFGSPWMGDASEESFTINFKSKSENTTEHKTVTRQINYVDENGQAISGMAPTKQTLSYHREISKNLVTGEVTKLTDWVPDNQNESEFASVSLPSNAAKDYINPTVNGKAASSVAAEKPTLTDDATNQDETVNVTYTKKTADTPVNPNQGNGDNNEPGGSSSSILPNTSGSNSDDQSNQNSSAGTTESAQQSSNANAALPNTNKQSNNWFSAALAIVTTTLAAAFVWTKKNK